MASGPAAMRRGAFRMAGRAGWALFDQGISSFTNFALGVLIARSVSATDFGAFTLAFSTYLVVLNLARAVGTQPLVIRYSHVAPERWRRGSAMATGTMIACGVAAGIVCIGIGLLLDAPAGPAFMALGVAMPALLAQDAWRFVFFAGGRDRDAVLTDGVFAVALVLILVFEVASLNSVPASLIGWGAATLIGAAVGAWRAKVVPNPFATFAWFREHSDLVGRYALEVLVGLGATQAAIYVVGFTAGLAEAGSIRAAQILLGPMHIVLQAAHLIAVPEGVRIRAEHPERFRLAIGGLSAGLAILISSWVIVLMLLPANVGQALLGDSWSSAQLVMLPLGLSLMFQGISGGALVGLRVLADAKSSLRARILDAGISTVLGVGGGLVGGAVGASWGFAIGAACSALIFVTAFLRSERRHRGESARPAAVPA